MSLVLSGVTNVIEACLSGSCQARGLRTEDSLSYYGIYLDCTGYSMLLKGTLFHLGEKACFRSRMGGRAGEGTWNSLSPSLPGRGTGGLGSPHLRTASAGGDPFPTPGRPGEAHWSGHSEGVQGPCLECGSGKDDPQTSAHPLVLARTNGQETRGEPGC